MGQVYSTFFQGVTFRFRSYMEDSFLLAFVNTL